MPLQQCAIRHQFDNYTSISWLACLIIIEIGSFKLFKIYYVFPDYALAKPI